MRRLHVSAYDDQVLAALHGLNGMATCREICQAIAGAGRFAPYGEIYASLRRMETDQIVRRQWYENSQLVFWESVHAPLCVDDLEESFGA